MTPNFELTPIRKAAARLRIAGIGAFAVSLVATSSVAQKSADPRLSPIEQRIRDYVRAHENEQIGFLEKAVNINSGTFNLTGVREVGKLFAPQFAALGFDTTWIALPDAVGRAGHFFAERKGNRGKRMILLGHLDTVFEGEGEKFVRLDTLAAGAGSSDMKGGDVVILYALKALQSVGALKGSRIVVALMGDEEDAGPLHLVSRQPLVDLAKRSDVALGFEEDAGKGTVARRGFSGWQLTVTARQAHSSGIFQPGSSYGAIYEAARILNAFRERLSTEQYLTFNPAIFVGGTDVTYDSAKISGTTAGKDNIIAPRAYARGDLRFISDEQLQKAREAMRAIVAEHLPGTMASITFEDGNPAMPPTKGNMALLAIEDSVSRALGQGPVEALDPGRRGGGDISYISQYLDALDGLGVKGMRSHTPDERVDLRSIVPATERAALLIYRLINK
ncbi:MAG TPA: M20/M25/M40 family metallo-hydrolase [Gemmatimonadaceae bacterium]|nr:M20/M25/M40 family metallo-hydrolase [Gemmatimonadaceae bacterium]